MRITNKMMNNTTLNNINNNKEYLDKLNNQLASEKKITRPSDDPIVAIRALKLRSNLTEITQYYDKNVNDATAWLSATQDAIESTQGMVTSMRSLFTQGSNATNSAQSRAAIIEELQAYRNQIYDDGNAQYAGRSLFTGFRTNSSLTMILSDADKIKKDGGYTDIQQEFTIDDLQQVRYVKGKVDNVESLATALASCTDTTNTVEDTTYMRIRLAYDNVDFSITKGTSVTIDGVSYAVTEKEEADDASYSPGAGDVYLIKSTGELVFGKDVADVINKNSKISYTYDKSSWQAGDIYPENYFSCVKHTDTGKVVYDEPSEKQTITYDISDNQKIEVNTTCNELYSPSIGRDIDDLLGALQDYEAALSKQKKVEEYLSTYDSVVSTDPKYSNKMKMQDIMDAVNKEVDATKEKVQTMFEHYQSVFDGYIEQVTRAATENGTRISRVELVENRLMDLKTTAKELADSNENVKITDIATQISEAKLNYEAALMATGKVSQVSLLNYI